MIVQIIINGGRNRYERHRSDENAITGCMLKKIDILFRDNAQGICFSTIHKSKGLEADNVYIIGLDKLPLKRAMNNPISAQQELNLQYVAITRGKKSLRFVDCPVKEIKIQ